MNDHLDLLREFRADVPVPTRETRDRIYVYATQAHRQPPWILRRVRRPSASAAPRARALRWGIAVLAIAVAATGAIVALTTTASAGQSIDDLVSQVRSDFGDDRILSASLSGSTLSVKLRAPDEPSAVSSTFEAQMLASAVRESMSSSSQALKISSVAYVDASGAELSGEGPDPVGSAPSVASLGSGACTSAAQAAQAVQASLTLVSALTLPYAHGACVFKFQTPDPASFAANANLTVGTLVNAIGNPNERPYLVEVDDQAGTPQFVHSFVPSSGGQAYIRPGLSTSFFAGGRN